MTPALQKYLSPFKAKLSAEAYSALIALNLDDLTVDTFKEHLLDGTLFEEQDIDPAIIEELQTVLVAPQDTSSLASLIAIAGTDLSKSIEPLEQGQQTVAQWHEGFLTLLLVLHTLAYMQGRKVTTYDALSDDDHANIIKRLEQQTPYADGFADVIEAGGNSGDLPWDQWRNRAASYVKALKATESAGRYAEWSLPVQPGEGSECGSNCLCHWEVVDLGNGNADAYWRTAASEHCPTCQQRAAEWSPLKIRGGRVGG